MPPKSVAGLLNNESNLRILEKLKNRPYYPRELAAEMDLSESFLVRRLKAMEEFDIVEGRWETEGNRKVKRYYVKDVTMQLGKNGLEVKPAEATAPAGFNLKNEAIKLLVTFYVVIFAFFGFVINQPIIVIAACLLMAWQMAVDVALYRHYHHKTMITEALLLAATIVNFVSIYVPISVSNNIANIINTAYLICFLLLIIFWIRFSTEEARDLTRDKRIFLSELDDASTPVKLFYLFFMIMWKVREYFELIQSD
jgi:hypothetical protein